MECRELVQSATGRKSVPEKKKVAAACAALLVSFFGTAGIITAQEQLPGSVTNSVGMRSGQASGQQFAWLKIMAFTDAPVVGADVRVSLNGRRLVQVPAATNKYGIFPLDVRSHPFLLLCRFVRGCRVAVSGGTVHGQPFLGRLAAEVAIKDPAHQIVAVNPVTTLVSRLMDRRPQLRLDQAEARVRTFLNLPANYSLGLALRQSSGYVSQFFSPAAFVAEAQAAGGVEELAHLLLDELLASKTAKHPFPPTLVGSGTSSAIAIMQAGLEAGILDYAGSFGVSSLTGWALSLTGDSDSGADSDAIDALLQSLADLQSSIDALSSQVAQLTQLVQSTATQSQYNTIVVPAQTLQKQVNGVESDLSYFAQACPPLATGGEPTPPDQFCTTQKVSVFTELNDLTIQQAYVTLEGYIEDNPAIGFRGMLHLYSLWLAQSKAFFRPADSNKMQVLYDYWDAALTQAANLKVELLHQNGAQDNPGGRQQLIDFMGNPALSPATTGTFQANQAANMKLLFRAVPAGTVVATQDHTMWSLVPWTDIGGAHSYPSAGCTPVVGPFYVPTSNNQGYAGFSNWYTTTAAFGNSQHGTTPSLDQWQAALKLAPPLSSGTDWQDWLVAETKTTSDESPASDGFFNIVQNCHYSAVWTFTYTSVNPYHWNVIVLDKNTYINQSSASPSNFVWPTRILASGEQYFWYN